MSVHQLKDGRWVCHHRNPRPPPRYKREYFGRGMAAEASARARDDEVKQMAREKAGLDSDGKTFAHIAQAYLEAKLSDMQETTFDRVSIKLNAIILPRLGRIEHYRLTSERIDAYVNNRLTKGTLRKYKSGRTRRIPITRTTVHGEVAYIQAILNWAVDRKIIRYNPLAGYKKPRRDDAIIQPVTAAETSAILHHTSPHVARAIALSYYTGLRPGRKELLRLQWSAIDWDQKTIHIVSARKGGLRTRVVPIHPGLHDTLRGWYEADGRKDGGYIITYLGDPIDKLNKAFTAAKRKAGITRKLPPYAFRHTFATNALAGGADLKSTSEILGHTRQDTTTAIYQHTNLALHRDAVSRIPPLKMSSDKDSGSEEKRKDRKKK